MKRNYPWLAVLVLSAWGWVGCQSPRPQVSSRPGDDAASAVRNNCGSLLYELLNDEKRVGLLRFIKRERAEVRDLIRRIAASSAAGANVLEELARHDPGFRLDALRLPPGEAATREAIAATRRKELLGQTGDAFETTLLFTQAQALSYAAHLAKVAGQNESNPDRARALAAISADMERLYQEVLAQLRAKR